MANSPTMLPCETEGQRNRKITPCLTHLNIRVCVTSYLIPECPCGALDLVLPSCLRLLRLCVRGHLHPKTAQCLSWVRPPAPPPPLAFLCVDSTQRSETGQVRGLRWHNRPREREGKECGEADGHGGLQRERPREGKGEGRGKVRARRKRKVKGW